MTSHRLARGVFVTLVLVIVLCSAGCSSSSVSTSGVKSKSMVLATTTSAEDSGILKRFVDGFESQTGIEVKAVAVGSGAALFMGRNGDADAMLTHEPVAEKEFMAGGYGESSVDVMHNQFIVVGPASDPAHVKGSKDAVEAFTRIKNSGKPFVSRGDASGTNAMEMSIWDRAGIKPAWGGYIVSGRSMGDTLRIADAKNAYTLTDTATFTALKGGLSLKPLYEGDPSLINRYTFIVINPKRFPEANHEAALALKKYLLSKKTQKMIASYGKDTFGTVLFYPDALKK